MADRSYFVTLRLHGSLPAKVVRQLSAEREQLLKDNPDPAAILDLQRKHFQAVERILDGARLKNCWLAEPKVASMILENLEWFCWERGWRIYAAVVMSTHLHILMRSEAGSSSELLDDLAHFKRFTARRANGLLDRKGVFWAREDFDHWIRNRIKFESTIRYILNNPVKAGLVERWEEWSWYYLDESIRELIEESSAGA